MKLKSLLLIEDDPSILHILKRLLIYEGFRVQCASNGQQALNLLSTLEDLPELIILDLMMPIMDGWEFRKRQLADSVLRNVPVVALSADSTAPVDELNIPTNNFLRKPVEFRQILDVVREHTMERASA